MGKTKKKLAQNANTVTKQSIHGIKKNSVQKNKSLKSKSISGSKTALTNNSKMQNKNKSPQKNLQKTTDTKSNQNLLQNNKKALKEQYSLKRKKNISNKSEDKPANKKMKKEELVDDDSWTYDESSSDYEKEILKDVVPDKKIVNSFKSKIEKDNDDSDSSSFVTDDEEKEEVNDNGPEISVAETSEEDSSSFITDSSDDEKEVMESDGNEEKQTGVPSILGRSLADDSEKDENFKGEDEDDEDKEDVEDDKDDDDDDDDDDVDDDDNDDDDNDDTDNEDGNDEEHKKLISIARDILEDVCEENYLLPFPAKNGEINRTSIKIENLPKDITIYEIQRYFGVFGSIKSIKFDLTVPFSYRCAIDGEKAECPAHPLVVSVSALIDYHCPLDANHAFCMNGQIFAGNYITVCYSENLQCLTFNNNKVVMLHGLLEDVDLNTIWNIFKICGEINYIHLYRKPETGFVSGQCIIYFETEDAASKAKELNGTLIFDCPVTVQAGILSTQMEQVKQQKANVIKNFLKNKNIVRALVEDRKWREKAEDLKRKNKAKNEEQQIKKPPIFLSHVPCLRLKEEKKCFCC